MIAVSTLPTCFVLGGGQNGLDVVRALGPHGIRCVVFSHHAQDFALRSRYAAQAHVLGPADVEQAARRLGELARAEPSPPVVIPCSDWFLGLLDAHRDTLDSFTRSNLSSRASIAAVLSKELFGQAARQHALPVPRTGALNDAVLRKPEALSERLLELSLSFPLIAKPEFSGTWSVLPAASGLNDSKALVLPDLAALQQLAQRWPEALAGAVLQEYLVGEDDVHYSFMAYVDRAGHERCHYGVRKLRINPIHNGVATCCTISDHPELIAAGRRIIQALDYRGCVSVCFKQCQERQQFLCYEVNGRMPLAHGVGELVGESMALCCYEDLAALPAPLPRSPRGRQWLRLNGDIAAFRGYHAEGSLSAWAWLGSVLRSGGSREWSWRDPVPCFAMLKGPVLRLFGRAETG